MMRRDEIDFHPSNLVQVQKEVEELIESIAATYQEFNKQRAAVSSHLDCLAVEAAEQESSQLVDLPDLEDGPDEVHQCVLPVSTKIHLNREPGALVGDKELASYRWHAEPCLTMRLLRPGPWKLQSHLKKRSLTKCLLPFSQKRRS